MEIQAATGAYRAEMDVIEQWLGNNCIRGPQFDELILELYEDYSQYIEDEFGRDTIPLSEESLVTLFLKEAMKPRERERVALERVQGSGDSDKK